MTNEKFYLHWYWRMQAQLGMSSAWLETRRMRMPVTKQTVSWMLPLSTDGPNLQALAWEMKARIAIASSSMRWTQSHLCSKLSKSCRDLRSRSHPGKSIETAWIDYRQLRQEDKAEQHRSTADTVIAAITSSFASDEPLREMFLKAHRVRRVLVNTQADEHTSSRNHEER